MKHLGDLILRRWPFGLLAIVAALQIAKIIEVDFISILLLFLAFLPAILPLLAANLESFKFGKDGIEGKTRANNEGITIPKKDLVSLANEKPEKERNDGFPLELPARQIISTLWHYQKKLFGEDSPKRWGFGIGLGAPDYRAFAQGLSSLEGNSLVYVDPKGLSYLTNEGMEFCKNHRDVLDGDGPYYTQFAPAK